MLLKRAFPQLFLGLLHVYAFHRMREFTVEPMEYGLWVSLLIVIDLLYYSLIKAQERIEQLERKLGQMEQDMLVRHAARAKTSS